MTEIERHSYDVIVVGAGGAGPARGDRGAPAGQADRDHLQVAVWQGAHRDGRGRRRRGHGQREPEDNWQVHFRDTMRGGKFMNHYRMAELHAKEAPDRIWELETYGALFDRTPDGKISQRNFGGHRVPAARPRRRPHRSRADPHAPAEDRLPAAGRRGRARRPRGHAQGLRRVHHHRAGQRRRPHRRRLRLLARVGPLRASSTRRRSSSPPAASASRARSPATPGSTPATATRSRSRPAARW